MKKKLLITVVVLIGCFVLYKWLFNRPCAEWEKPDPVPKSAIWSGGCDGGHWIELVDIKENMYRFRIYHDWSGELKMDVNFEFTDNKTNLTRANWKDIVCCYSQSLDSLVTLSVVKTVEDEKKYYQLQSIYPAYGGDDWEIIKEKYNLE